jgi:hypothetical protein
MTRFQRSLLHVQANRLPFVAYGDRTDTGDCTLDEAASKRQSKKAFAHGRWTFKAALGALSMALALCASPVIASAQSPATNAGQVDPVLVGHYGMSGIMETASELLLKADGRFEWYMSYGSVDLQAKGNWHRSGDTVSLVSDPRTPDTALFRPDKQEVWNNDAEIRLRDIDYDSAVSKVIQRCPLLAVEQPTTMFTVEIEPKPIGRVARARAKKLLAAALAARAEVEQLAALAFSSADDAAGKMEAAKAATGRWYLAKEAAERAHHDARMARPDLTSPALPPACQLPTNPAGIDYPVSQWKRGIAIVIDAQAGPMRFPGTNVTFTYSDGHSEIRGVRAGGWAIAPVRPGTTVGVAALTLATSPPRSVSVQFTPLAEGIQTLFLDLEVLRGPAFEVMNLKVDGALLVAGADKRMKYHRRPTLDDD